MFKKLFYDYVHILWKEYRLTLIIDTLLIMIALSYVSLSNIASIMFIIFFFIFLLFRFPLRFRFFLALLALLVVLCLLSVIYFYPYLDPYKNTSLFPYLDLPLIPTDKEYLEMYREYQEMHRMGYYDLFYFSHIDFSHISSLDKFMLIFHPQSILLMLLNTWPILFIGSSLISPFFLNLPFSLYLKRRLKYLKKIPLILIYSILLSFLVLTLLLIYGKL